MGAAELLWSSCLAPSACSPRLPCSARSSPLIRPLLSTRPSLAVKPRSVTHAQSHSLAIVDPGKRCALGAFALNASHTHFLLFPSFAQPYRELHKRIIAREAPQRYVTWRCNPDFSPYQYEAAWCGGLRDRTFGIVNAFLYAVLNDRAFLMDSKVSNLASRFSVSLMLPLQFPAPWEDLMDSPNGIEWQYTRERERYINTLNHTEVIYQIGNPHDPFDKHDQIKDYQNVILVRCNFLSPRLI
jgi:hypothetical protein